MANNPSEDPLREMLSQANVTGLQSARLQACSIRAVF